MIVNTGSVKLELEGLGPLVRASIDVRPLTVFIGPNGSGKSYTAMLLYALYKGILAKDIIRDYRIYKTYSGHEDYYSFAYKSVKKLLKKDVEEGLKMVFGGLGDIVNVVSRGMRIKVSIGDIEYIIRLNNKERIKIEEFPSEDKFFFLLDERNKSLKIIRRGRISQAEKLRRLEMVSRNILMPFRMVYLPASRSGLIHGHRMIASTIIEAASRLPLLDRGLPRLPAIVADFIAELISIPDRIRSSEYYIEYSSRGSRKIKRQIVEFLEKEIIKGNITISEDKEFMYESNDISIPVVKAASGIAELAPLVLYLKHGIIGRGDMVIFEEPEAHLHPDLQRKIARLLAMLVRNGVRVVITTHSDILLEEFNILMRLERLSQDKRMELGYMVEEYLSTNDLGVYLFNYDEQHKGYTAKELEITEEEGIPQDELTKVALLMGETHARISHI